MPALPPLIRQFTTLIALGGGHPKLFVLFGIATYSAFMHYNLLG
jgi:hypothetical protein